MKISVNAIFKDFASGHPMISVIMQDKLTKTPFQIHKDILEVLSKYADVFSDEPPRTENDFRIELKEVAKPIIKGLYHTSHFELKETKTNVENLLGMEFVRHCKSSWVSPELFSCKKDGDLGLCVDYRALNRLAVKNSYHLARIHGLREPVGIAQYFSTIVLSSGYHQMWIAEKDIMKTAFSTRYSYYEYTVVLFGLINAPAGFISIMSRVFHECIDKFVLVYLDDILFYSKSLREHISHIRLVLQKLKHH